MKRGPIALSRILMYDGDTVMFNYMDKRTNTKETMTMSIDEFIAALIRHIQNKISKRFVAMESIVVESKH